MKLEDTWLKNQKFEVINMKAAQKDITLLGSFIKNRLLEDPKLEILILPKAVKGTKGIYITRTNYSSKILN